MIVCPTCGNQNADGVQFCTSCRTYLAWDGDRTPAQPVPGEPASVSAPAVRTAPDVARPAPVEAPRPPGSDTVGMAPIPPAPVKPGVEQHGPPPDGFVPPRRRPEQALYCSVCGTDNELDRRLCRSCGAVLPSATADRQPWWRRIFRGSTAPAAGDRPGQRRRAQARRGRRAIRAAIGLALLGAVAVLAFPARGAVVSAYHKVADRFSTGYERVTAVSAQASTSAKGHEANKAIDGVKSTAWAEGVPGRGTNQWLTIRLGGKADLAQIGIIPGASDNEQAFRATSRPREILLRFSNRTEQTIKLRDEPTFQTFGVSATGVDSVRLDVLSAFPGQTRLDQTSIAEVEFYVKK